MKTINYALLGILAALGTLTAEERDYQRWQRELATGGRVYLPEGWDRTTTRECDDNDYYARRAKLAESIRVEQVRQNQAEMDRYLRQLEQARQAERARLIEAIRRAQAIRP